MNYTINEVTSQDIDALANLRISAMKESLENLGRFDPDRARRRFVDGFEQHKTRKILIDDELAGFFVLSRHSDHLYIEHLYIHPTYQGIGLGGKILSIIKQQSNPANHPIRLGALKGSRSNLFYQQHGFRITHDGDWDNYYEFQQPSTP